MTLFIILYVICFISALMSSYKVMRLDDSEDAFMAWIVCAFWPFTTPLLLILFICMKIHKLLLKL